MKRTDNGTAIHHQAELQFKALKDSCGLAIEDDQISKIILDLLVGQVEQQHRIDELERHLSEECVSKHKYAELYDFAPSGCITATRNGLIVGLNSSAAQMLRIDSERIGKKLLVDCLSDESRHIFTSFLERIFVREAKETCEVVINGDGNSPRDIVIEGIISLTDGECLLTMVDISEQRQTLEALRLSEGQFRFMFANNPQPMWILDSMTLEFLEVNHAVVRHYGYSRERYLSMSLKDICPQVNSSPVATVALLAKSSVDEATEITLVKENGESVIVSISSCSVIYNGHQARHFLVTDLTERNKSKERIEQQNAELSKMVRDKDRFITILAHDLKRPFHSLLTSSESLLLKHRECDASQIESYALQINQSSKKIYNLLDDLLIWAQSQAGKIPYRPVNTNLAKICYNVVDSLREPASKKNITINLAIKEDVVVFGDVNMVRVVVKNLIGNGIKYNKPGGRVDLTANVNKHYVRVSVEDSGIGITPESISKLFDISEAKTTVGTENETGTGLGLLICKDFVERHGGKIAVESESGKGAKISFFLPKG